jgi:hypothetical protein
MVVKLAVAVHEKKSNWYSGVTFVWSSALRFDKKLWMKISPWPAA